MLTYLRLFLNLETSKNNNISYVLKLLVINVDDNFTTDNSPDENPTIKKYDYSDICTDGPNVKPNPERSDLSICSSTISGYASIRNKQEGSWYIQELCNVLLQEGSRYVYCKFYN